MAQSMTDIKQEREKEAEGEQAQEWERALITLDRARWRRKNNLKYIMNL